MATADKGGKAEACAVWTREATPSWKDTATAMPGRALCNPVAQSAMTAVVLHIASHSDGKLASGVPAKR